MAVSTTSTSTPRRSSRVSRTAASIGRDAPSSLAVIRAKLEAAIARSIVALDALDAEAADPHHSLSRAPWGVVMTGPSRHGLLAGLPTVVLLPGAARPSASPDAALIAACDTYRGLMDALNCGDQGEAEQGPVHDAYSGCCDTISDTSAQTMAGVVAKCRVIQVKARDRAGEPTCYHEPMAED